MRPRPLEPGPAVSTGVPTPRRPAWRTRAIPLPPLVLQSRQNLVGLVGACPAEAVVEDFAEDRPGFLGMGGQVVQLEHARVVGSP